MMSTLIYSTPLCRIRLEECDGALMGLDFMPEDTLSLSEIPPLSLPTPLLKEAVRQLDEYFAGQRQIFNLPLRPQGTPFMLRVWEALRTIPYGLTVSYAEIAARIDQPRACRAVGMANNRNPLSIVIPCHRVIGKDGRLVGYGGGLHIKRALLELEGVALTNANAKSR